MGEENSDPLQLGDVVMSERPPFEPPAANGHALQPERGLVLRIPDQLHFDDFLRMQFGGGQCLLDGCAAGLVDRRVVEKLLELLGGGAQIVQVRDFRDPFLPAIGAFPPHDQVGRRNSQKDAALQETALDRILKDIELGLGEVPLHVKPRAHTNSDEVDVESGGGCRVFSDFDGLLVFGVQSRGVARVERFLELACSRIARLE